MRRFALLFALTLATVAAGDALAGRPKDDGAAAAEGGKKDPYAIPEMKITKIADFDALFDRSKSPIESMILSRKRVDMAKGRFNTSMGLAEDLSFEAALTEFKGRMEGKANIALKKGVMPKLTTADVVPDDLQKSIDELNACITEVESAYTQLGSIKGELATIADEASKLDPAAAATSAGLNPLDSATAAKNTAVNVKTVSSAKDESEKLYTSIEDMAKALEATFGPAQE